MDLRRVARLLLALGLLLALALPAGAQERGAQERRNPEAIPLVAVDYADEEVLGRLLDAGLDIVDLDRDERRVTLLAHPFERRYLERNRIAFEVIDPNANVFPEPSDDVTALANGRTDYRYLSDYYNELQGLAQQYPQLTRLETIGYSIQNRPIVALEISSAPGARDGRPEHVHMALHHAREWPSGELAMDLAWYLLDNYNQDPRVTDIVNSVRVFVIPVVNPDGFNYSRTTYPMWRKNRNPSGAVDLNRNYAYYWGGPGSSGYTSSEVYRGTAPFSEPETRTIRDFLLERHAATLITGHTHGGYWLHSWGHKTAAPPDSELGTLAAQSVQWSGYRDGQTSRVLYTASGDTTDWAYGVQRSLAFTPEYGTSGSFHPPYQGSTPYPHVVTDNAAVEGRMMEGSVSVNGESGRLVDCGLALSPNDCPSGTQGAIALIERGSETFANKANNAAAAGAIGAVIYNNTSGHINGTLAGVSVPIPVFGIPRAGGLDLLADMSSREVHATLDMFASDSYGRLWAEQLPAFLLNIEAATTQTARITGSVTDASTGQPVTANLQLQLTRRSFDAYNRTFHHNHQTAITATGTFDWAVVPSRQPELSTPAYTVTISAPNYQSQQRTVTLSGLRDQAQLHVQLQPLGALSTTGDRTAAPALVP